MAAFNYIAGSIADLTAAENIGSDQWAIALTNTIPSDTTFVAGTTDLPTGSGYTQGGNNVATTSATESGGVQKLILADPAQWSFTGAITFQYALLVNKTTNKVRGYWSYPSPITTVNGDTFTVDLDGTEGVFQVNHP